MDFEPNDSVDQAEGRGVLSVVIDGGAINDILTGSVALVSLDGPSDPADVYRYVISTGLQSVWFSASSVGSAINAALDEPGVHGVADTLTVTGLGGFTGNSVLFKVETGSYVTELSDEYFALLTEIDTLETQVYAEYVAKQDGGVEDPALLADAQRLATLEDQVFALHEAGLVNIDHDIYAAQLQAERDAYQAGSGYIDDIRAFMDRAIALTEAWDDPVYSVFDQQAAEWVDVGWIDFHAQRLWAVAPNSTEAFLDLFGSRALATDPAFPFADRFRPLDYQLNLTISVEVLDTGATDGPDDLAGDNGPNILEGLGGDDTLDGGSGDDTLAGGPGDDSLIGGAGRDTASYADATGGVSVDLRASGADVGSGEGADSFDGIEDLEGSPYQDTLQGDNGANRIWGLGSRDVLWGWDGDDTLFGGAGNDSLRAGADADTAYGGAGNDYLIGNTGNDTLQGGTGDDDLNGGNGLDLASFADATGAVHADLRFGGRDVGGGLGADTFTSIEGLIGSAHDDRLVGDAGANTLRGGAGDDILKGKGGPDLIEGGDGADKLRGGDQDDSLDGGAGSDTIFGLGGADSVFGGAGDDWLYAGRGGDTVQGGTGNDRLRGNRDADLMEGGADSDDLRGGGGNDSLSGGADADVLFGETGADTLSGGTGNDVLTGGRGMGVGDGVTDIFVFAPGDGWDRVKDFEDGIDRLDLTAFALADADAARALASDAATGLRLDFGGGDVLFLDGMTKAQLDVTDLDL